MTMLWATACTCFFGFLRSGEATVPTITLYDPSVHLSVGDISLDSQSALTKVFVRIKASKTNPFRQGISICLGKTGLELCPVAALFSYIALRGTSPDPLLQYGARELPTSCEGGQDSAQGGRARGRAVCGP